MAPDKMEALEWLRKHLDAEGSDLLREMVRTFAEPFGHDAGDTVHVSADGVHVGGDRLGDVNDSLIGLGCHAGRRSRAIVSAIGGTRPRTRSCGGVERKLPKRW